VIIDVSAAGPFLGCVAASRPSEAARRHLPDPTARESGESRGTAGSGEVDLAIRLDPIMRLEGPGPAAPEPTSPPPIPSEVHRPVIGEHRTERPLPDRDTCRRA